jgi:hypothetical protein
MSANTDLEEVRPWLRLASPKVQRNSPAKRQADSISQRTRNSAPPRLTSKNGREFDAHAFLATIGEGRKAILFPKKQTIFAQGEPSDAVFYLQTGKVRLTVVSKTGKEVTIGILMMGVSSAKVRLQANLSAWALQPQ